MARDYTKREMRLVAEWVAAEYRGESFAFQVRVGTAHPELLAGVTDDSERRMIAHAFRRFVDGVVYARGGLTLIEAKIVAEPGCISQLELYMRLAPQTPELRPWADRRVKGVLLVAVEDPVVTAMANERGIRVAVYRPAWVDDYLSELRRRERRAPLTALPA